MLNERGRKAVKIKTLKRTNSKGGSALKRIHIKKEKEKCEMWRNQTEKGNETQAGNKKIER